MISYNIMCAHYSITPRPRALNSGVAVPPRFGATEAVLTEAMSLSERESADRVPVLPRGVSAQPFKQSARIGRAAAAAYSQGAAAACL